MPCPQTTAHHLKSLHKEALWHLGSLMQLHQHHRPNLMGCRTHPNTAAQCQVIECVHSNDVFFLNLNEALYIFLMFTLLYRAHAEANQTFFSMMVTTSGRPPTTLPRSAKKKHHTPVRLKDIIISIKDPTKRPGLEWVYSLFSAYASALKGKRRMVLLVGSLVHANILPTRWHAAHMLCIAKHLGESREPSSLHNNDYLTWVSGTPHRHFHRLGGGREKIKVKLRQNKNEASSSPCFLLARPEGTAYKKTVHISLF